MIIKGRLIWTNVFTPQENLNGDLKYGITILIPKTDEDTLSDIRKYIDMALAKGLANGKIRKNQTQGKSFKIPLRDGDEYYEENSEEFRIPYKNNYFINSSSNEPPAVINKKGLPLDPNEMYSGCYGAIDVVFYCYNVSGSTGIGCYLHNVLKTHDGDRLDGRKEATEAFKMLLTEDEEKESEDLVSDNVYQGK